MNIENLKNRSYVPYASQPQVAVVQSEQGHSFPGVRVENISYPLTISAIQSALFCCMSEGEQPQTLYTEKASSKEHNLSYWLEECNLKHQPLSSAADISFHPILQHLDDNQITGGLQKLLENPYVQQSNFPVAALLETDDGYVSGKNIEPTNWNRGLCAERVALAKAIAYGATYFKALHITTQYGEYNSPCGACRQVILEHMPHRPVYLHEYNRNSAKLYSSDLLPYSFQSSKLQHKET